LSTERQRAMVRGVDSRPPEGRFFAISAHVIRRVLVAFGRGSAVSAAEPHSVFPLRNAIGCRYITTRRYRLWTPPLNTLPLEDAANARLWK